VQDPPGVGGLRAGDEQDPLDMCGKRQSRLHGLLRCLDCGQAAFCDGQVWDHVIVGPTVGRVMRERFPDRGGEVNERPGGVRGLATARLDRTTAFARSGSRKRPQRPNTAAKVAMMWPST
jgi:hypothetical protein